MKHAHGLRPWHLTLIALALLLTGCGHSSPLSKPTQGPAIPPLPTEARQTESPTFSRSASSDIEAWLQALTEPSQPGKPASEVTKR